MDETGIIIGRDVGRAILEMRGKAVRADFGGSVRQIFSVTEHGTPDPLGSGVLITVEKRHFLVSAAHVLAHSEESTLYLGGETDLVLLEGVKHYSRPTGEPPTDQLDIAFMELSTRLVQQLGDVRFLVPGLIDPNDNASTARIYVALGFPWRKTKKDLDARRTRSSMMSVTALSDSQLFQALQVPEHAHVVIPFTRETMIMDGKEQAAPKPEGMSGGGLFRSDHLDSNVRGHPVGKLVGILTQYRDRGSAQHMRATRISVVLEAMRSAYPDLSEALPRSVRARISVSEHDS